SAPPVLPTPGPCGRNTPRKPQEKRKPGRSSPRRPGPRSEFFLRLPAWLCPLSPAPVRQSPPVIRRLQCHYCSDISGTREISAGFAPAAYSLSTERRKTSTIPPYGNAPRKPARSVRGLPPSVDQNRPRRIL